jgi:hypothetical protein
MSRRIVLLVSVPVAVFLLSDLRRFPCQERQLDIDDLRTRINMPLPPARSSSEQSSQFEAMPVKKTSVVTSMILPSFHDFWLN